MVLGDVEGSTERWEQSRDAMTAAMQEEVAGDYGRYHFHLVAQKLQSFCSEDLGAFYLDILKDRLYTCRADSPARRSAPTAWWPRARTRC